MKAIKSNLGDHLRKSVPHDIMLCTKCGAEYSAHEGDYWYVPDNHRFKCCGKIMVIGHWQRTFIESYLRI